MEAVKSAFRNMFSVRGRASRSAYWWFVLFSTIAVFVGSFLVGLVAYAIDPSADPDMVTGLALLLCIPVLIAQLTLLGRRLHDTGKSAHFLWLMLIPYVGGFALFIMSLLDAVGGGFEGSRCSPLGLPAISLGRLIARSVGRRVSAA